MQWYLYLVIIVAFALLIIPIIVHECLTHRCKSCQNGSNCKCSKKGTEKCPYCKNH